MLFLLRQWRLNNTIHPANAVKSEKMIHEGHEGHEENAKGINLDSGLR
jgi:hypothetical protein